MREEVMELFIYRNYLQVVQQAKQDVVELEEYL
jgi:hypothetical protein